jgi:hypothetical protein
VVARLSAEYSSQTAGGRKYRAKYPKENGRYTGGSVGTKKPLIVGIAVDDYKVEKFKAALAAEGFEKVEASKLKGRTSMLRVLDVPPDRFLDIHRICRKLDLDFRRSN